MKKHLIAALNAAAMFAFLLLVWQAIVWLFKVPDYMLPPPMKVANAMASRSHSLRISLTLTGEAAAGGLAASVVVGVAVALMFAQWRWLRTLLYPYTIVLQTVPILAVTPLILMWMGPGLFSVMVVTFIICLAPIIANTTQGLISVDENLINLFLIHRASRPQLLMKLRLPHAMPSLFVGFRIAAGISVIGAITGEWFAGSSQVGQGGLGYSILYASQQLQTAYMFALVAGATALGFGFYFIAVFLEWWFLHNWHESARSPEAE